MRIALGLEYHGTPFHGWQSQADGSGVQNALERALSEIAGEGNMIRFDLHADAFLYRMVRNIVGALVYVGNGRQPPSWIGELLAGRDRTRAAPTFASAGLYFTGVDYPTRFNLPATCAPLSIPLNRP